MDQTETLDRLRCKVLHNMRRLSTDQYAHNKIGILLSMIDDEYGEEEAQRAIKDFGLDKLGW